MNKKFTAIVTGFGLIVLAACNKDRLGSENEIIKPAETEDVTVIISTLRDCGLWYMATDAASEIMDAYKKISIYDNDTIRNTLIVIEKDTNAQTSLEMRGKVFALLRYLFDIPPGYRPLEESEQRAPGGWGSPVHNRMVNILWPLTMDESGHLRFASLKSDYLLYTGELYSPVKDFDFMIKFYKRRK
jgi:hypothetical protein